MNNPNAKRPEISRTRKPNRAFQTSPNTAATSLPLRTWELSAHICNSGALQTNSHPLRSHCSTGSSPLSHARNLGSKSGPSGWASLAANLCNFSTSIDHVSDIKSRDNTKHHLSVSSSGLLDAIRSQFVNESGRICGSEENKQCTDNKPNVEHLFHFSTGLNMVAQFLKNATVVPRCES